MFVYSCISVTLRCNSIMFSIFEMHISAILLPGSSTVEENLSRFGQPKFSSCDFLLSLRRLHKQQFCPTHFIMLTINHFSQMMIIARLQNWRTDDCKTMLTVSFSMVCSSFQGVLGCRTPQVLCDSYHTRQILTAVCVSVSYRCNPWISRSTFTQIYQKYFVQAILLERNLILDFRLPSDAITHFQTTLVVLWKSPARKTLKLNLTFHVLLKFILPFTVFQVQVFYFTHFF